MGEGKRGKRRRQGGEADLRREGKIWALEGREGWNWMQGKEVGRA